MGHYYNHPTIPFVFFTVLASRRTNKAFTFSIQLPVMLCWSLVLLLFVQNSEGQPSFLTVEPSQQAATVDGKKHAKAVGPEIFTTSSLPAASPAGMVTSITDLSMQEQDTFDNKLAISTSQSFPEQFQQQAYSQPKTKQDISLSKVSPHNFSKSRTNNVRPQGSLTTFPEEEEKMFPELLPVVTLVEKLQSQVLDLQRMRLEDRWVVFNSISCILFILSLLSSISLISKLFDLGHYPCATVFLFASLIGLILIYLSYKLSPHPKG